MFDDQLPNATPAGVPGNLPLGEPEDMFAGTDPAPASPPPSMNAAEPEDPLEPGSPSALAVGALQPAAPVVPPSSQAPSLDAAPPVPDAQISPLPPPPGGDPVAPPPPAPGSGAVHIPPLEQMGGPDVIKEPSSAKFIMTIILSLVAIGVLGGVGYLVFQLFGSDEPATIPAVIPPVVDTVSPTEPTPTQPTPGFDPSPSTNTTDASDLVDDSLLFGEPIDNDSDNLDNAREVIIGTDPDNWDTDGDGLGDGDEVIIWKTDPQNPDSDGDGFSDGDEVRNGYSPTGDGRIFEPPTPGETSPALPATSPLDVTSTDPVVAVPPTPVEPTNEGGRRLCGSDAQCITVATVTCDEAAFEHTATFDLRSSFGVLQDVTYEMIVNGESSDGSCNVTMKISHITLAFTEEVPEEAQTAQLTASAEREGRSMNCQIASTALVDAINMRQETDLPTRLNQTGQCLGPLADEVAGA